MGAAAIHIDDLAFRWKRGGPLCVQLAQLAVDAGQSLFLQGPSGSGKTTLLNLIGGVLLPERGRFPCLVSRWVTCRQARGMPSGRHIWASSSSNSI
jgi:putative ABC transport system ATP-binding protein